MLKSELLKQAKELKIKGRSKMTKDQLVAAIKEAGGDVDVEGEKKEMKQQKIDTMYKVDTPPAKKVAKKADPSPKSSPRPSPKKPKMSPKMQEQLKAKLSEVAESKK